MAGFGNGGAQGRVQVSLYGEGARTFQTQARNIRSFLNNKVRSNTDVLSRLPL